MNPLNNHKLLALFNAPETSLTLTNRQWSDFIFVLRENDLLARFHYLATKAGCFKQFPEKVKHHLCSAQIKANKQAIQAKFEALELTRNLDTINVKPIFLKGVAYSIRGLTASKGRIYSDMDVLVNKQQLNAVERKLSFSDWFSKEVDDYDDKYYRQWAHEIPPMIQASRGTIADIHHNLLPPISGRAPNIELFTQNLFTTADGLLTLNKPAMVLHSIIHLFFNEEFTNAFRDLTDLHLMFSEEKEDNAFWQELFELAQQSNFCTELFYAIHYGEKITGTIYPEHFLNKVRQYQPNKMRFKLANFIFTKVLLPYHSKYSSTSTELAIILGALRGHLLKMPLHILVYHSLHKAKDSITKLWKSDKAEIA